MSIDIALLRKTLDWALDEHRKAQRGEQSEWEQGEWLSSISDVAAWKLADSMDIADAMAKVARLGLPTACGTACCIAGKIALDAGYRPSYDTGATALVDVAGQQRMVGDVAAELLGTTYRMVENLFYGHNTIYDLYRIAGELTGGEIEMPAELLEQP